MTRQLLTTLLIGIIYLVIFSGQAYCQTGKNSGTNEQPKIKKTLNKDDVENFTDILNALHELGDTAKFYSFVRELIERKYSSIPYHLDFPTTKDVILGEMARIELRMRSLNDEINIKLEGKDAAFAERFKKAQEAWLRYMDAAVEVAYPYPIWKEVPTEEKNIGNNETWIEMYRCDIKMDIIDVRIDQIRLYEKWSKWVCDLVKHFSKYEESWPSCIISSPDEPSGQWKPDHLASLKQSIKIHSQEYGLEKHKLDSLYNFVLEKSRNNPIRTERIKKAQKTWEDFFSAEMEAIFPSPPPGEKLFPDYGEYHPLLYVLNQYSLTIERVREIDLWLNPRKDN